MQWYTSGFELMSGILRVVLLAGSVFLPLIIMRRLGTFLVWLYRRARGQTYDALYEDYVALRGEADRLGVRARTQARRLRREGRR